jgi:excisionase family DNA binding protein
MIHRELYSGGTPSALVNVDHVAQLLDCSTRHVRRLVDMGKCPPPVRLGSLVRWQQSAIEEWISQGCPRFRTVRSGGAK